MLKSSFLEDGSLEAAIVRKDLAEREDLDILNGTGDKNPPPQPRTKTKQNKKDPL